MCVISLIFHVPMLKDSKSTIWETSWAKDTLTILVTNGVFNFITIEAPRMSG